MLLSELAMKRTVEVFLGDQPRLVGRIRYRAEGARQSAAFEYGARWLVAPDRFSIDPTLPLA